MTTQRCFDVTLKGYHALDELGRSHEADNLDLVNWVRAPNEEAIRKFLQAQGLTDHVEDVRDMEGDTGTWVFEDGVDVYVGPDGEVLEVSPRHRPYSEWIANSQKALALAAEPSLYDRILPICRDALAKYSNVEADLDGSKIDLTVAMKCGTGERHTGYTVSLDEADVDESEVGQGAIAFENYALPQRVTDHVQVLDVCIAALAADKAIAAAMSDLSTDGDGKDCEAIFNFGEEGYLSLKVRQ